MPAPSLYLKHEIAIKALPETPRYSLGNKLYFVGIDMAPIENLETGIAVLDRDKRLVRMDKLNTDEQLELFLKNLAPRENLVVSLDVPKSLSIPSKWRQQQVKMHPLQLRPDTNDGAPSDRFAQRAKDFYQAMDEYGVFMVNFFTSHARLRYDLSIPFRNRSPQGCRALQGLLKQRLDIKDVPTNLAPSSVLDAMVAAYAAWGIVYGEEGKDFQLYTDDEDRLYLDPLGRPKPPPSPPRRGWRRRRL